MERRRIDPAKIPESELEKVKAKPNILAGLFRLSQVSQPLEITPTRMCQPAICLVAYPEDDSLAMGMISQSHDQTSPPPNGLGDVNFLAHPTGDFHRVPDKFVPN